MCDNKKTEFKEKFETVATELGKTGKKVAKKTVSLADVAATRIKIKSTQMKLKEEYEILGRLSYDKLVKDYENTERIAIAIENIDNIRCQLNELKSILSEKTKILKE